MNKNWRKRWVALTFVCLCLITSALFEWRNCIIVSSSHIDPTFNYISSVLPDASSNCVNRISKVKYSKSNTGVTPTFETLTFPGTLNCFYDYYSSTSGVGLIGGIGGGNFERFCQLTDIPPPSITA